MEGMPELRVVADETNLVFEGHLGRALALLDEDILGGGSQVGLERSA